MLLSSSERDDLIHRAEHPLARAALHAARRCAGACRAFGTVPDARAATRGARPHVPTAGRRAALADRRTLGATPVGHTVHA